MTPTYRHAFECRRCPGRADEQGCPAWTELVETNVATGEERLTKACLFTSMPRLLVEVIKASNRPAAAIESTRDTFGAQLAQGFTAVAGVFEQGFKALAASQAQRLPDHANPDS